MIDKYFQILGLSKEASLIEIKKAYKKKAKELHPDLNDSPNAKEDFILLNEAYEYLQNVKTGKVYNQAKQTYSRPRRRYKGHQEWERREKAAARKRAKRHAEMHFEEFEETAFFQTTVALNVIADFLEVSIVVFILVGFPLIGYFAKGITGLVVSLICIFITSPYWANILVHNRPKLNFKELFNALSQVFLNRVFGLVILTGVNLYVVFKVGLNTLLLPWQLVLALLTALLIGILIARKMKSEMLKYTVILGLAPALLNTPLLINYIFSENPVSEVYAFDFGWQYDGRGGTAETTFIHLENEAYSDYPGLRLFIDYKAMEGKHYVKYTFEEGFLGVLVLKDSQFRQKP